MFKHVLEGDSNAMATDQACYALISYDRLIKNKTSLYDMSDVNDKKEEETPNNLKASLSLPTEITDDNKSSFKAVININGWDNNLGYKLIDFVMNIPNGLNVTNVTAGSRLEGGNLSFNFEADTGKLRTVYFDAVDYDDLTVNGTSFPAELFSITLSAEKAYAGTFNINLSGMSVKLGSDSSAENSMIVVDTSEASGTVNIVNGVSFSAVCLYTGDDVDLIPSSKKAIAVSVVGINNAYALEYNDGINEYQFRYSEEISEKTGISTYVALTDSSIDTAEFINQKNFTLKNNKADEIIFGDSNGDGVVNAQDALRAVDTWLRKGQAPDDNEILSLNVNGDSRINTFDAVGIAEYFVCGTPYVIVSKAAELATKK